MLQERGCSQADPRQPRFCPRSRSSFRKQVEPLHPGRLPESWGWLLRGSAGFGPRAALWSRTDVTGGEAGMGHGKFRAVWARKPEREAGLLPGSVSLGALLAGFHPELCWERGLMSTDT